MKKPYPAFCKDCKHSKQEINSEWILRCHHPVVNANDYWSLSGAKGNGTDCRDERKNRFFAVCGMRGKRWEPK